MSKKSDKKENDGSAIVPVLFGIFGVGTMVVVGAWEVGGRYVYGTTPAQIEALSLEGTPKQVAKGLTSTDVSSSRVRATLKAGAGKSYEYFEMSWNSKSPNATSVQLTSERAKEEDDRGEEVVAALARRFHAMHDGSWRWGRVEISAHKRDGSLEASVDPNGHKNQPNPLFDRQMDAARQILLEVAFGIPVHASDAELAEVLGTGYKTADVGKIDPQTPIENVPALIASRFPGSIHDSSSRWEIAVDHPLLIAAQLDWSNRAGGHMNGVRLEVDDAYAASRDSLESCLANVLGAPQTKVTDYAAGKKDYVFTIGTLSLVLGRTEISVGTPSDVDGASFSKLFDALAGCRDKTENTGARGDGRKK